MIWPPSSSRPRAKGSPDRARESVALKNLTVGLLLSLGLLATAQPRVTPPATQQNPAHGRSEKPLLETTDTPATTDEAGLASPATIRVDRPSFANPSNVVRKESTRSDVDYQIGSAPCGNMPRFRKAALARAVMSV